MSRRPGLQRLPSSIVTDPAFAVECKANGADRRRIC